MHLRKLKALYILKNQDMLRNVFYILVLLIGLQSPYYSSMGKGALVVSPIS